MKIPLAEHYHSLQGEGVWFGTPMHFIRLAGCSVGQYPIGEEGVPTTNRGKPAWKCHTWDGRPFWCDTDFTKYEEVEIKDLLEGTWEDHICLTGGEPLMHQLVVDELIKSLPIEKTLHIETSGTVYRDLFDEGVWLTLSPKKGCKVSMIDQADEVKLLVDEDFDPFLVPSDINCPIFLQPINHIQSINGDNLQRCKELLKEHPSWRLSPQVHKLLGWR